MSIIRRRLHSVRVAAAAAVLATALANPAHALFGIGGGDIVYDPSNHAENILQAARALEQIQNQIRQLQNETQMLVNMAKHLENLDYSSAAQIQQALAQINLLMQRAEGIAFEIGETESEYARLFPEEYTAAVTADQLVRDARERWRLAREGFRHTMLVQAQVTSTVAADAVLLDRLVSESQAAVGSLQAQQAGNQLLALNAKQALQLQQLLAAQGRAEAVEQARAVESQEQARARFARFVGDGRAYTPLP